MDKEVASITVIVFDGGNDSTSWLQSFVPIDESPTIHFWKENIASAHLPDALSPPGDLALIFHSNLERTKEIAHDLSSRCLPFIVYTEAIDPDLREELFNTGAQDVLSFDDVAAKELLPRTIRSAIYRRRAKAADSAAVHSPHFITNNFFRRIADTVPGVIIAFNLNPDGSSHFPFLSSGIERLYHYSAEVLRKDSSPVFELVHPDDLNNLRTSIARSEQEMSEWHCEWRIIHPERGEIWVEGRTIPQKEPDGSTLWIGILTDVTERKSSEKRQNSLNRRLKLALGAGGMGIWALDILAETMLWDDQLYAIFGASTTTPVTFDRWLNLIHPRDLTANSQALQHFILSEDSECKLEFRILRESDQRVRFLSSRAIAIRDETGAAKRVVGITWDVTEERVREKELSKALIRQKKLTREAEAGQRARNEFLSVMSHEIRTPLNAIICFAELLESAHGIPSDSKEQIDTILQNSGTLLRMLDDVLQYSQLESGRIEVEESSFSLRELLSSIEKGLDTLVQRMAIQLSIHVEDSVPPSIIGDSDRLLQVLFNIIENAVKFTDEGSVTVNASCSHELLDDHLQLHIKVQDTGKGISYENQTSIYDPFVQEDSSASRRHGGTGLGLTISKRLIDLLNGTLHLQSEPGKGSLFSMSIPVRRG